MVLQVPRVHRVRLAQQAQQDLEAQLELMVLQVPRVRKVKLVRVDQRV